ncbi:uncharacterized protein LOC111226945 isoform X1 [Seriola dumerili]|uniref:uncharacterized protein LOC111226945 isoform X1 n=1 Tax=Seriola dumerili TaxID=41447 RepID=UPI000BBE8013|nr:uncharacterized protein LOC111226945 isoform X1 [Seriola dumerili]
MRSFTVVTVSFLCCMSWISVSVSQSQTVEVQSGEDITLVISNISSHGTLTEWFRLFNRTKVSCIASMYRSDHEASFCDGFQNRFEMSSNISNVFLKIKRVDVSDSGLYFCGFYIKKVDMFDSGLYFCGFYKDAHTVITDTIHLNVHGDNESDYEEDCNSEEVPGGMTNLMSVVLGGLTVFLTIVVIVLAVKIRKLQKDVNEEPQTERNKNLGSDDLNYTTLSFQTKPKRNRRPASQRELETNVVYAATR